MGTKAFLSIITISFNQRRYVQDAIRSVLAQKTSDIEYIVVDPGSTDGSREIILEYGDQIDHIVFEPDAGPADGLNNGFARATGTYGFFLNSDDILLPGAIDRLRQFWRRHPDADASLCHAWMIDGAGAPLMLLRPTPVTRVGLASKHTAIVQHGFSFSMEMFKRVGGFEVKNRSCWDYELMADMARYGARFRLGGERIAAIRLYSESLTGGGGGEVHAKRMQADSDRIYTSLTGRPADKLMHVRHKIGRIAKHFIYPMRPIGRLIDETIPGRLERRWLEDTNGRGVNWMND